MELRGERLSLRPWETGDLTQIRKWVSDPEVSRWLVAAWPPPSSWETWLHRTYSPSPKALHFAIVLHSGRHIGICSLHIISWTNKSAEVGVMVGEKECWGQGYGPEALRLLLRYAFRTIGLKKVVLHVHRENYRAIRAYKKVGFVEVPRDQGLLRRFFLGTDQGLLTMEVRAETWVEVTPS